MLTSVGPSSFVADSSSYTPATDWSPNRDTVAGAGTLSFVVGDQKVTLSDFPWADPSVHSLDEVGQYSTGSDGALDYVGGLSLSVATIPEPGACALFAMGLAACFSLARRSKR